MFGALAGAVSEEGSGQRAYFRALTSTDMISIKFFLLSCGASSILLDFELLSKKLGHVTMFFAMQAT